MFCVVLFLQALLFSVSVHHALGVGNEDALAERVAELSALAAAQPVIRLDAKQVAKYLKAKPRNYSVVAIFTALSAERNCDICQVADQSFSILADSWRYSPVFSNELFLVQIDFDVVGPQFFQEMNVDGVPLLMHFPAKGKPKREDKFQMPLDAKKIVDWVQQRTQIKIEVRIPVDYTWIAVVALGAAITVVVLYCLHRFLSSSTVCGFLLLAIVFVFQSGWMWTQIRGARFSGRAGTVLASLIAPDNDSQFQVETYVVAAMYMGVSAGMLLMTWSGEAVKRSRLLRSCGALLGVATVAVVFSLQLSVFNIKMGGSYPYRGLFDLI